MNNINILPRWESGYPVRQRADYCTTCGRHKSIIERWNECTCRIASAKRRPKHLNANSLDGYDSDFSWVLGVNSNTIVIISQE